MTGFSLKAIRRGGCDAEEAFLAIVQTV